MGMSGLESPIPLQTGQRLGRGTVLNLIPWNSGLAFHKPIQEADSGVVDPSPP